MVRFIREQKNLKNKTILLRADLDEPHDGKKLLDDYRIRKSLPTIEYLHKQGAKIIILSKIGRPKKSFDPTESLFPAAERLAELLNLKLLVSDKQFPSYDIKHLIFFNGDIRKKQNQELVKSASPQDIVLLENMRFYPEEENCDPKFAEILAGLGDIYVNDAFAVSHRSETSVTLLPKILPSFGGFELEQELFHLNKILHLQSHPFLTIMGGAKISDKVDTIRNLAKLSDKVLIGGALANLFFLARGFEIGKSRCETEKLDVAKEFLRNFKDKIILPKDVVVADQNFEQIHYCPADQVKKNEAILDIGPATILEFSTYIKTAKKMIWNGPLGLIEKEAFANGTMSIARLFASKCKGRAFGLVGGGDTLEAINKAKVEDQIDFVSTGGGAMLQFFSGQPLPGIVALEQNNPSQIRHDHLRNRSLSGT